LKIQKSTSPTLQFITFTSATRAIPLFSQSRPSLSLYPSFSPFKASAYKLVEENAKHMPEGSFWYAFDYQSEMKSAFHLLFMDPAKKAQVYKMKHFIMVGGGGGVGEASSEDPQSIFLNLFLQ
jgi:histone deacetylase complex regulatory component SIN3